MDNKGEKATYFIGGMVLATVVLGLLYDARVSNLKFWLEFLTAAGTLGAVFVALYFSYGSDRREKSRLETEWRIAKTYLEVETFNLVIHASLFIKAYEQKDATPRNQIYFDQRVDESYIGLKNSLLPERLEEIYRSVCPDLHRELVILQIAKDSWLRLLGEYKSEKATVIAKIAYESARKTNASAIAVYGMLKK